MSGPAGDDMPAARAFAERHLAQGEAGRTLLVLLADGVPRRALAAGLRDATQRVRFAVLARHLIRQERAEAYWLIAPMAREQDDCLLVEVGRPAGCRQAIAAVPVGPGAVLGEGEPLPGGEPLLGDLFAAEPHLPGLLRRRLDDLADTFALPLPA